MAVRAARWKLEPGQRSRSLCVYLPALELQHRISQETVQFLPVGPEPPGALQDLVVPKHLPDVLPVRHEVAVEQQLRQLGVPAAEVELQQPRNVPGELALVRL